MTAFEARSGPLARAHGEPPRSPGGFSRTGVIIAASVLVASAVSAGAARQTAPPQATFHSAVDLFQLDVTVIDKDRHPVPGLTAADFTILEDGKARDVITFKAIDVPPAPPPAAAWVRDIAPDVVTNTRQDGRIVVVVIDDGSFQPVESEGAAAIMDTVAIEKVKTSARAVVNGLGPGDLAALVFTENNFNTEDFTLDHRRLLTAIDRVTLVPSGKSNFTPVPEGAAERPEGGLRGSCMCGLCSMETVERVAESLGALKPQRKTLVYISAGVPVKYGEADSAMKGDGVPAPFTAMVEGCAVRRSTEMANVFRQAQRANVTIQSIDPRGPMTDGGLRTEFLRTMAETTGGRAIVNTNAPEDAVPAMLEESSAYYMLGYESGAAQADGRFHAVKVRVNRPGLTVLTRAGFYAPTAKEQKNLAKKAAPPASADAAIAGPLASSELPLSASLAAFLGRSGKAEIAVVLAITEPNDAGVRDTTRTENVELVASAFGPSGDSFGSQHQSLTLALHPSPSEQLHYETMARFPIAKGRYQFRIGVRAGAGRIGSVYVPIDVPDFVRDPMSVSGVLITATPSPKIAPKDALKDLVTIVPTARRVFGRNDVVSTFVRVYQARAKVPVPVTVTTYVTNSMNGRVSEDVQTIEAAAFLTTHSVDRLVALPVHDFLPGRYLVTINATTGARTIQRTAVFTIQ